MQHTSDIYNVLLSTVELLTCNILEIIINLNPNKAHGHDVISIWMLKICNESICKPLGVIFRSGLENSKSQCDFCIQKTISKS